MSESLPESLSAPIAVFYVGIDWAAETHYVCVLDDTGRVKATFPIQHSADGFAALIGRLGKLCDDRAAVAIGIERPDGRLVDALLEAGHPVVPVSPNAIKTWRDGEVVSGAKSDAGDSLVIAEYLRLRQHRLRVAVPFSDQTKALRTAVRTRTDLVETRVATTNQLTALLDMHWPGAKAIFADVASPIALKFLTRYPTPASAARLGHKRIAAFCAANGYSGRRTAADLLARLRAAPAGTTSPSLTDALQHALLAMVGVLTALNAAIAALDKTVVAHLGEHPDGPTFTSLPRSGQINAAQMLAEWGDCREAYDSADAVAALAGLTPVTKESGKHRAVSFRWACNTRFRVAMTIFADNSRHASPWAADIYNRARHGGKDHPHAIRILARSWTRVIYRCWQDRTTYETDSHGAVQRLAQPPQAA